MSQQFPDRMEAAMPSPAISGGRITADAIRPSRPPFDISIVADDGTVLLRMTERDGYLVVEGEESRWDEAAKRFLYGMMQWSGQVGLRWKDEAARAVEDR